METTKVECYPLDTSGDSLKIYCQPKNVETHIPLKLIYDEVRNEDSGLIEEITIPTWLAIDRGLT